MSFPALLKAAEQLQQKAERKRGTDAAAAHALAVAKYREALAALSASGGGPRPPPPADVASCLFGLAESLQEGAEATSAACAHLPDEALTAEVVQAADNQAAALLRESVATYRRVLEGGQPRADALVCAGNALSTWAEICARREAAQALPLLQQATECYQSALQQEEDALTWSNLADCLVQRASLCCEAGQGQAEGGGALPLFQEALQAYHRACSLSDAADGDDVPGLLINWSRGLLAMAQQAQEAGLALQLLEEAARRLQQSIDFLRGSPEPFLALGDVLLEQGERLAALGANNGSSGSGRGSGGDAQAAAACLRRALGEGYQQAQLIRAHNPEAAVGVGDVHVQLARLAAAGQHAAAAAEHWAVAEAAYRAALQQPTAFDFGERCDVRYNHACCLARCGRGQEAAALLRGLLALGAVSPASLAADADLAGVALA